MPKTILNYEKTIMYKIVCDDLTIKDCYVGHTTNMTKRKYKHKTACNNEKNKAHNFKIYQIIRQNGGWSNWSMLLIETFPCKDKHEACKREREIFEELDAKMNMVKPYRTQEEIKLYYQDHKEDYKENQKKYYQDHKENSKENSKQYYQDHKEQAKLYYQIHKAELNEKIQCEYCSKLLSKQNITRHHSRCKSKSNSICL